MASRIFLVCVTTHCWISSRILELMSSLKRLSPRSWKGTAEVIVELRISIAVESSITVDQFDLNSITTTWPISLVQTSTVSQRYEMRTPPNESPESNVLHGRSKCHAIIS